MKEKILFSANSTIIPGYQFVKKTKQNPNCFPSHGS